LTHALRRWTWLRHHGPHRLDVLPAPLHLWPVLLLFWGASLPGPTITAAQEKSVPSGESQVPKSDSPLAKLLLSDGNERSADDPEGGATEAPGASQAEAPRIPLDASLPAGVRWLKGEHIDLLTDLPADLEVEELPKVFDLAVEAWGEYFQAPPEKTKGFRATACLMKTPDDFRPAGLFPGDLPKFREGFHRGLDIWLYEQPTTYYRRHLLLHEGVHAFSRSVMGGAGPAWYREGVAEFLATHRWDGVDLISGYMPKRGNELPGWGRLHTMKREFTEGRGLMLGDILAFEEKVFLEDVPYAWSWGAVAFLNNHPVYRTSFRRMTERVSDESVLFSRMLYQTWLTDLREIDEEWQLFVAASEYGYDFIRNAVSYREGKPLGQEPGEFELDVAKGWQSSGFRLEKGESYLLKAQGMFQIAKSKQPWISGANGVTLRYYEGLPLGQLVGNVRTDAPGEGMSQLVEPIPVGSNRVLKPVESGTLYLRVNDVPSELVDNEGSLKIRVERLQLPVNSTRNPDEAASAAP
jgi:hypothetical protein